MFLDLCIEIFMEQKDNSRIIKSLYKHIAFLKKKKKMPKGFKTSLEHCKAYITALQQYLKKNSISILKRLECPIGPSAK